MASRGVVPLRFSRRACLLAGTTSLVLISASSHALYRHGDLWPKSADGVTRITVCFIKSGQLTDAEDTRQRQLIQEVLAATWNRWMKIEISGFATCASPPANGTLAITLWGTTGTGGAGDIPDQTYHPGKRGWHGSAQPNYGEFWLVGAGDRRARNVITHEFGHGLSFEHEQSRPDAQGLCTDGDDPLPAPGNPTPAVLVTSEYDDTGIMNYCSTIAYLSRLDVLGAQTLYDKSAAGQWLEALPAISSLVLL